MHVVEKEIVIDDQGTKMWSMAYNGWLPGPLMVVHEGDYLHSPWSTRPRTRCPTTSTSTPPPARSAAAR